MASLKISFTETGDIQLLVTDCPEAWSHIHLIVTERAEHAKLKNGACFQIPWWEFAPILPLFHNITNLFPNLSIEVDEQTSQLISRAHNDRQSLDTVNPNAIISPETLKVALDNAGFIRPLTEMQLRNVGRLAAIPNGATFSVPGAGKTTEALATYAYKTKTLHNIVVVCPKNAFAAWEEQVKECLPQFLVTRLTGGRKSINYKLETNPKISVITYSQLTNVTDLIARHIANNPTFLILDESHKIKGGEQRAWASAALSICHLPEFKLIMSGTPMPNDALDLLPQIRFLYPTLPIDINPIEAIQPIYVRTTKNELDIPPVLSFGTPIPLTDAQARLYRLCASQVARDAEIALQSSDKNTLRGFGRSYMLLLQLVSNPSLLAHYQGRFKNEDLIDCLMSDSPKITYACHRARQLASEGKKVIIWSGFVQNVEIISQRLQDIGADFIHGDVEAGSEEEESTREFKIARFHNDSNAMVLVANPAACSEGISLHTICHNAIYVDRNYNAAQFLQSSDRIHRYGIDKNTKTEIEFIFSPGTIDDSVNRRLNFKINQMENALRDPGINLPTHWRENLDELPDVDDIRDLLNTLKGNEI